MDGNTTADCPATATIQLGGELCTAICNLPAGHDEEDGHKDLVLGEWGCRSGGLDQTVI